MGTNLENFNGLFNSQNILLALIKKGVSRQKAYDIIQKSAMETWKSNEKFEKILIKNKDIIKYIKPKELRNLFASKDMIHIERIFKKTFKNFNSKKK